MLISPAMLFTFFKSVRNSSLDGHHALRLPKTQTTRQINFLLWLGDERCPTGSVLSAIFGGFGFIWKKEVTGDMF